MVEQTLMKIENLLSRLSDEKTNYLKEIKDL